MGPLEDHPAGDPSVLSLIVDSQNRIETKLDRGLAHLEAKMDGKADKTDMARIESTLDGHAARLSTLEREAQLRAERAKVHKERDDRTKLSRKAWLGIMSAAVTLGATLILAVATAVQAFH